MGEKETEESEDARKGGQVKGGINVDGGASMREAGSGGAPEPQDGAIIKSKSNITNN